MKIAFDPRIFTLQEYGGISRYFCSLVSALNKLDHEARIFAPVHQNKHLSELDMKLKSGRFIDSFPNRISRLLHFYSRVCSSQQIHKWQPDVVHETYYTDLKLNKLKDFQTVITVYDMIHELYADEFRADDPTTNKKLESVKRADHILCISNNTRDDLVNLFDIPISKTSVVHLAADDIFIQPDHLNYKLPNSRPFILFVGSRYGYKNFTGFMKAFSELRSLRNDFNVVCFGGGAFTNNEVELFTSLGLKEEQILYFSGNDLLLKSLYHQAEAFIYPSVYEGFGIPPLEAMATGCAVISSNTSSLPEVVGNAGEYFVPTEIESIKSALETVLLNPAHKSDLIEKGFHQYKKFSWQKCATETAEVYRGLL